MRKNSAFIAIFFLTLISSCAQITSKQRRGIVFTINSDTLIRFDEIAGNDVHFEDLLLNHKLVELDDTVYIYTCLSDTFYYKNIITKKLRKVHLSINEKRPMDFLLYKKNQLALVYENKLVLYDLRSNDTTNIVFNFRRKYDKISEIVTIQPIMNHNITYINDRFYIPVSYKVWANTKAGLVQYYEYPHSLELGDNDDNLYLFGSWPTNYSLGNYYGDYFYWICDGLNNELIYSFRASDSLFLYNDLSCVEKVEACSKGKNEILPYPVADLQDFGKIRQYNIESARYEQILCNKNSKQYYRVYKPQGSFLNENDKIRKASEIPWRILVFDEAFNKLGEVEFDAQKFSFYRIYLFKNTLYIISELTSNIENFCISYHKVEMSYEQ